LLDLICESGFAIELCTSNGVHPPVYLMDNVSLSPSGQNRAKKFTFSTYVLQRHGAWTQAL